ncbi:MAG: ABC transporter substrate-binding protein, partial [Chloroflexota bacterium]|nr:ABC transporter substrate-binding protein [Chloroflexota bacterium]
MKRMQWAIVLMLLTLLLAACPAPPAAPAGSTGAAAPTEAAAELTPVRLQLQWVTQSQFAGYYAALDQGYYTDEGLDVTILEGAVEIV